MTRPAVSVVMPFKGDGQAARGALASLRAIDTRSQDELILADNSGAAPATDMVLLVRATAEHSPAYARNVGAEHAKGEWILFLDADCHPSENLLDAYFKEPVEPDVGALAGEVVPAGQGQTLAARYAARRSFLSQRAHLAHPFLPRAVAANLLVRRAAFEQVGGFYEGVRAAEDTDFSWRLQQAGWRLELRSDAKVEHRYRSTLRELRRQWRGYAAGRAWLARRYDGFEPEPAVRRVFKRAWRRLHAGLSPPRDPHRFPRQVPQPDAGRLERGSYLALDTLLAVEELAGLALSNRPSGSEADPARSPKRTGSGELTQVVLIAERFPARQDPLVDFATTLKGARIEAVARPEAVSAGAVRQLEIAYREDDGSVTRALALGRLIARHPLRCALDAIRRAPGQPSLRALAPASMRLARDPEARVHAVGGEHSRATARRLAALAGRPLDPGGP